MCAAISNSSYMVLNYMLEHLPGYLKRYKDEPGDFRLDISMDGDLRTNTKIKTILELFETAIGQIAVNYPKHCTLEVKHDSI